MRLDSGNWERESALALNERICEYEMGKPEEARAIAGCSSSNHGLWPYFLLASSRPRTVPGTPAARQPSTLSFVGFPLASRYMSCVALRGAFSRKSINVVR